MEREGNGHHQVIESTAEYILPREKVERILGMSSGERVVFDKYYAEGSDIMTKYTLARGLIHDGRFDRQADLLNDFLPKDTCLLSPKDRDLAVALQERLHFLLIEKGVLPPGSIGKEASERYFHQEVERRQNLKDLIESNVPIEVMGQLITVDLFSNITDEKKLEEYRAWVTRSILRVYVGTLSGRRTRRDLGVVDVLDRIPRRIFSDPNGIKYNLVENYIEQRLMRNITDLGIHEGFAAIDSLIEHSADENQKAFISGLADRFLDIATYPLKGNLNNKITIKNGAEKTFPSFEQRTFVYDFTQNETRLLAAETGLGKTGTAYLALENSDAIRVLVFAPADNTAWPTEESKLFKEPGNVYVVKGSADLKRAAKSGKKYIVLSQRLLGLAENNPTLVDKLQRFVEESGVDSAIIDEIDNLNNPKAISTKTVVKMVDSIRRNYTQRTGKDESRTPIIGLTATPIRNRLINLNVPMGILYPDRFSVSAGEATATKKTFSDTCLNRPDLAHAILIGERKMFRWEQATGVQEFSYDTEVIPVEAFEDILYTFIANEVPTSMVNKVRLLENVLFNPLLVKAEVREMVPNRIPQFDMDDIIQKLIHVTKEWKKMRGLTSPISPDDYLSASKLVELGMGEEVLACFFSDLLENGVDTLVEELAKDSNDPELAEVYSFWKSKYISSKYAHLEQLLKEKLSWKIDRDGRKSREKVFIVSPSRKQGRTSDVMQRGISTPDGSRRDLYTQYELDTINDSKLVEHIKNWTQGLCEEKDILILDGSVSLGKQKDEIIAKWVNDPNAAVLVVTLEATYQSRDYTLNITKDPEGRDITGIEKVFLSPPWYYQQLKQMAGRSIRQGHLVPVHVSVLESEDLVDHGKGEGVLYSYLLSRMALSGIILTSEEQEFFDSKRVGRRIAFQSPEKRFLRNALSFVRGAGEDIIEEFLKGQSKLRDETTVNQLIAEKFFDEGQDEYHVSGYNAELVAFLTKRFVNASAHILSIGAGTLLLQRKLQRGIDNVDINPCMMQAGWQLAGQYGGRMIEGKASRLLPTEFPSSTYDLVDNSFALHWSRLEPAKDQPIDASERVKILLQMNRLLKTGGKLVLTIPEKSLDEERFHEFVNVLERHFGFKVDQDYSGKSFGRSKLGLAKRLGWCITASKESEPKLLGLNINNLEFVNEKGEWVSTSVRKRGNSGVQGRDYPTPALKIDFEQYEIIDANGLVTTIAMKDDIITPTGQEVLTGEEDIEANEAELAAEENQAAKFLKGSNKNEYKAYRSSLIRPALKIMNKNWIYVDEVEEECLSIFEQIQQSGENIRSRVKAFSEILRELKKKHSKNGRREV
jgi:SAM-dependent methyltransferase